MDYSLHACTINKQFIVHLIPTTRPIMPHEVILPTLFYSILMLISNFSYLAPIVLLIIKNRWIYVGLLVGTFSASTYYHICFENIKLPSNYSHHSVVGWLFYDQFKCYVLTDQMKTILILLDYVFANTSTIAGLIILFPLEYLHPNSPMRIQWDKETRLSIRDYYEIQCYDYWTTPYPNIYRNGLILMGFMMNWILFAVISLWSDLYGITVRSRIWILNLGTFLFLFTLFVIYWIRVYITYKTHPEHISMPAREFMSLLWENVFRRYYTAYFHWKWLVAALTSAFVGLILWSILQRVLPDHHYAWVHPLWHLFSSNGMLFLSIAFKTNVACDNMIYMRNTGV